MCELLERMRKEMFSNTSSAKELTPQIDAVVLLDRNIDLMTPLSTQLTYEGLIDEIYGINHSECVDRGWGGRWSQWCQEACLID